VANAAEHGFSCASWEMGQSILGSTETGSRDKIRPHEFEENNGTHYRQNCISGHICFFKIIMQKTKLTIKRSACMKQSKNDSAEKDGAVEKNMPKDITTPPDLIWLAIPALIFLAVFLFLKDFLKF
jgi:hypothetical protein